MFQHTDRGNGDTRDSCSELHALHVRDLKRYKPHYPDNRHVEGDAEVAEEDDDRGLGLGHDPVRAPDDPDGFYL